MVQWNLYKAETIDAKRSVCFVEMSALYRFLIFFKIVWPQSKAIRSLSYSPPCGGVRFIVCPLYRDSTVILLNFLMTRLLGKTTDLKNQYKLKIEFCNNLSSVKATHPNLTNPGKLNSSKTFWKSKITNFSTMLEKKEKKRLQFDRSFDFVITL